MSDMFDKETLDMAREKLMDMAVLVEGARVPNTKCNLSTLMWQAFRKGRKYGEFVSKVKSRESDKEIETALMDVFCGVWQLQENIETFFNGIEGITFDEIVSYIKDKNKAITEEKQAAKFNGDQSTRLLLHFAGGGTHGDPTERDNSGDK